MVRYALVTIDAGPLPGEQVTLMRLGGARVLPRDIHGISAVTVAAFQRVVCFRSRPFMDRELKSMVEKFFRGIDGADDLSQTIYLCGPLGFMDTIRLILGQVGCDMNRLHLEVFGGMPRRNTKAAEAQADKPAKVVFSASNIEVDCIGSDYVLDLALDRGLEQAFSCRAGQCGTCKSCCSTVQWSMIAPTP